MAFLSLWSETFSKPRGRCYALDFLSCFIFAHLMAVVWADRCWYQSGCGCHLLSAIPLLQFVLIFPHSHFLWVDRSVGTSLASPSPSCPYSDFKCATTIISLHQKPCISSFLKCQAFLPFDVNDCWTYIKKNTSSYFFSQCAYSREWPVELCLAGKAWQLAVMFLV